MPFSAFSSTGFSTIHLTDVGGGLALNTKLAVASLVAIGIELNAKLYLLHFQEQTLISQKLNISLNLIYLIHSEF